MYLRVCVSFNVRGLYHEAELRKNSKTTEGIVAFFSLDSNKTPACYYLWFIMCLCIRSMWILICNCSDIGQETWAKDRLYSALKLSFLLAWDCWEMTPKSWNDTLCSSIKQAANTLGGKLCQKSPLASLLTFNFSPHHFTSKKNKNVCNSKDSKALEKLPGKEMLQCLKRSLNKHISEMCLKLRELSQSCYFAAGETVDGCKGCQGSPWRWKSPTSPLVPSPRRELWLVCWGKSQHWQPLNQPNLKF